MAKRERAAAGFTVKSGWACAVLIGGTPAGPRLVDSRRVEISDPGIPDAKQPYHAGFGTDMNAISRPAIASYADLQKVVRYWQKTGIDAASIQKLAIGNYARVLKQAMAARKA